MKIVARTDIGLRRKQNQDCYATGRLNCGIGWAVVCDGMGGAAGGDCASRMTVDIVSEKITSCIKDGLSENSIRNVLVSAIESANICVYDYTFEKPELAGMGTTIVAAVITQDDVYIAYAGDSRAYFVSDYSIRQITTDHSVVQNLVDSGMITREQAREHPDRNIITRAVGVRERISVDFLREGFETDQSLLICTDGLSGYVPDEDIAALYNAGDFNDYADRLVNLANNNGGGDNITVVTVCH